MPKNRVRFFHQGRTMSSINSISPDKLSRLIGIRRCPALIDVRTDEEYKSDSRFVPGAKRPAPHTVSDWAVEFAGHATIVIDYGGEQADEGVVAWLRYAGAGPADVLSGGHLAWIKAGGPPIPVAKAPRRNAFGRTTWVMRSRPKVDRIACPWLIRRFVDPTAAFLFVAPAEVSAVAERFGGAAFDTESAFWSDRGERCTFDTMLDELGAVEPRKDWRSSFVAQMPRTSIDAARGREIDPVIPYKANEKNRPAFFAKTRYKARSGVEQGMGRLKRFRRVPVCCKKTERNFRSSPASPQTYA